MQVLVLTDGLSLTVEPADKKVRLIISKGTNELACHKEKPAVIRHFIVSDHTHLFKGRLQLRKSDGGLSVLLNDQIVGFITVPMLEQALG